MRLFYFPAVLTAAVFLSSTANACTFHNPGTCGFSAAKSSESSLIAQPFSRAGQYDGLELSGDDAHVVDARGAEFSEDQPKGAGSFAFNGPLGEAQVSFPPNQVVSAFLDIGRHLAGNSGGTGDLKLTSNNLGWISLVDTDPDFLRFGDHVGSNLGPSVTPLPASWTMMLTGLALLGSLAWFRRSFRSSENTASLETGC